MTPVIPTDARPGEPALSLSKGPTAKRQPSPEGLGPQSRRGSERRRCGPVSLGAKQRDRQFPSLPRVWVVRHYLFTNILEQGQRPLHPDFPLQYWVFVFDAEHSVVANLHVGGNDVLPRTRPVAIADGAKEL